MSEPAPLPEPELQFIDANGNPYAGGTLELYEPGTSTFKDSWIDAYGLTLNTNPIVLDAAGRCIVWGDGDYRCVLRDAVGNLVYDQESTTVVSAAMMPVVSAPTIADARRLLGIDDAIQAEIDRAEAAEAVLQNEITAETARAEAAETALQDALNAEIARAEAAEANLQSQINAAQKIQAGYGITDSSGSATVTFPTAFSTLTAVVASTNIASLSDEWIGIASQSTTGFSVYTSQPVSGLRLVAAELGFFWIAVGT